MQKRIFGKLISNMVIMYFNYLKYLCIRKNMNIIDRYVYRKN